MQPSIRNGMINDSDYITTVLLKGASQMNNELSFASIPESVLVIGGGIIGCSIAYEFAKRGIQVSIVERGQIGHEATSAAAGILAAHADSIVSDEFWQLLKDSQNMFQDWKHQLETFSDVHINYEERGIIRLCYEEKEELWLRQKIATLSSDSVWRSKDELTHEIPTIGEHVLGGVEWASDHQVNPHQLALALRVALQKYNVKIFEGVEATSFTTSSPRTIDGARLADGRTIKANHVVIAGGAWTGNLLKSLGWTLPIHPVQGQCYQVRPKISLTSRILYTQNCHIVPKSDGTVIVGQPQQHSGFEKKLTIESITSLHDQAVSILPGLKDAEFIRSWVGLQPATPDGWPILGQMVGYGGLTIASGHFKTGILLAPITGKAVVASILNEPVPAYCARFSPNRFEATVLRK